MRNYYFETLFRISMPDANVRFGIIYICLMFHPAVLLNGMLLGLQDKKKKTLLILFLDNVGKFLIYFFEKKIQLYFFLYWEHIM